MRLTMQSIGAIELILSFPKAIEICHLSAVVGLFCL